MMIARIWHGMTPAAKADAYAEFLNRSGMRDYRATPGNLGAYVLRRIEGDLAHFLTLSFWEDADSVRAFAGPDMDRAHYYPEDSEFLLEFEPGVMHYDVLAASTP